LGTSVASPTAGNETEGSSLDGPQVYEPFERALDEMVALARQGQRRDSEFFNPNDEWIASRIRVFSKQPAAVQQRLLSEFASVHQEGERANAEGKAARRAGPEAVVATDAGGLAFYSQLGVARRPDLTQYFIDGFPCNRDALAFSAESQRLFAEILPHIISYLRECFQRGDAVIQSDRRICDAPGRSFHARQLLLGDRYMQLPYLWRQLTFELPEAERPEPPDIIELSLPRWLEDVPLPADLIARVKDAGLEQLVFKAPTKGLSFHLGFDYAGEHKMGPLTIAMFKVKEENGVAVQAALSVARLATRKGETKHTALVTIGPSLHGKSTLTIMIDPTNSDLADKLGVKRDATEGVYPMNDDIVLLQPLAQVMEVQRNGNQRRITYSIDGTENNFYAVPFGVTQEEDPITWEVLRGTKDDPNPQETLENVVVDPKTGMPDYLVNPTRNMRAIFSRKRLLERKGVDGLLSTITGGRLSESVHVPLEDTDRVLWQAVMRQNTVIPPLRKLNLEQYVRALMYGEAVQMGAATGAIGKPYVEYFSDPFIIGLEDENANLMYHILRQMEHGGQSHEYYAFNTGGIGAETNDEASGPRYKKIARDLTLTLQEALLRDAVRFEYDSVLGSDVAVGIVDTDGRAVVDLREEWLPRAIYGDAEYHERVIELRRRRFYGKDASDKAGILRYTKVCDALLDVSDIPPPTNEREISWLLSFYWHVDRAYATLPELEAHRHEGMRPPSHLLRALSRIYQAAVSDGIELPAASRSALAGLGLRV
jgi:hypothetical protein